MNRVLLIALTLVACTWAFAADSCARGPVHVTYDFAAPLTGWTDVREARFPQLGQWIPAKGGITNFIPEGADEKAVVAMKDGLGMTSSIIDGLQVRNITAIAQLAFEAKGAPAILLRAQVEGNITGEMLSLVLYEKGINLWRFDGEKWHKATAAKFAVEPDVYHRVKVTLSGPAARIWVDGKRVADSEDIGLDAVGAVGLWAGEGPCYFKSLRLRYAR